MILKGGVVVFMIQETKMSSMQDFCAKSLWSGNNVGYSFSNSYYLSGSLITLWKEREVEVLNSFKGEGYLGIKIIWKDLYYYMVNIYSSCLLSKKKEMLAKLLVLKEMFRDREWIIGGDFNVVKHLRERRGRSLYVDVNELKLFAEFIEKSGLVDVPCEGKKLSWYSGDGKSMSRMDRFIMSNIIVNKWGVIRKVVGSSGILDHCPIWLVLNNTNGVA